MSTLKSSNENLTLNADGSGNDIKFQSNGVEKASLTDGGVFTATSFTGSGANLTSLPADSTKLSLSGGAMTGAITTNSTFDGVDIATRDAVLTSTTTTANAALPKAGGTMTGNLDLGDSSGTGNNRLRFGANNDLEIYHNGSDSYIKDDGDGDLIIRAGDDLRLQDSSGDAYITCNDNDSVELYHNGSKKLETTSTGVNVTGYLFGPTNIGLDSTDKIQFSDGSNINFVVNGGDEMRLEADGDLHVDGDVIAYSTTISDERLKENIKVVNGALDKVKQLKGVTFNRKQDGQESAGVIAQDVEKVLPQAVKHKALPLQTGDDELFKTVQYDALHALLIEAVKELSEKVEKLENK